jgi:4-diphosphocytidyl-2-C-methyl-D-erythritol kinase
MEGHGVRMASPAKINLGLRILGKRPDGYHAIESIFQMLDLCDWLSFRPNAEGLIHLTCPASDLPTDERNLVVRAAHLLRQTTHVRQGVHITLENRIPIAAGLGGGSSNAATTLLSLNRLWGLNCPIATLHMLAAQLGSDVPFFLNGPTALVEGRGEVLSPLPPPAPWAGVLVNPRFGIPAGWAYAQFVGPSSATDHTMGTIQQALRTQDLELLAAAVVNDLEPGVGAVYPVIHAMQSALRAMGAATFMSGSGPTVCGLFHASADVVNALAALARHREWTVTPCAMLSQRPLPELQG